MLKFTNLAKPENRMKVITRLLPLYFSIVLLVISCGTKAPTDELDAIKYTGLIRVGTSADAPPFESLDERGQMVGFDIDLINEIGKRMGVAVEIQNLPYEELIPAVQDGKVDIAIAALNTSVEPDQNIEFTVVYFKFEDGMAAVQSVNRPALKSGPLAIAVRESANQLIKALNKPIADMLADGFIDDLSHKYHLVNP